MKHTTTNILEELIERYPSLQGVKADVQTAFEILKESFEKGNRVYLCGNGGSAADCEHMAGELLKTFKKMRAIPVELQNALKEYGEEGERLLQNLEGGLPVVSLCGHFSFSTAYLNDNDPQLTFAQQVNAWGKAGDVLVTFSTSGNSKNCIYASVVAKAMGMKVVFLGGGTGGRLKEFADLSVVVPERETYKIQELHLPIYHCICAMLEEELF